MHSRTTETWTQPIYLLPPSLSCSMGAIGCNRARLGGFRTGQIASVGRNGFWPGTISLTANHGAHGSTPSSRCKCHQATLAEAWNRLVSAAENIDWNQITVTQYIRALKELIHSERLVVGQPVEVEKFRHLIETAPQRT